MPMTEQNVISTLRNLGKRITKQKSIVIRNIIANPNSTVKEIYYLSKANQPNINLSTVYRVVKSLEEVGLLGNRNICFCPLC